MEKAVTRKHRLATLVGLCVAVVVVVVFAARRRQRRDRSGDNVVVSPAHLDAGDTGLIMEQVALGSNMAEPVNVPDVLDDPDDPLTEDETNILGAIVTGVVVGEVSGAIINRAVTTGMSAVKSVSQGTLVDDVVDAARNSQNRATSAADDFARNARNVWRRGGKLSRTQSLAMRMHKLKSVGSAAQKATIRAIQHAARTTSSAASSGARSAAAVAARRSVAVGRLLTANGLKAKAMAAKAWMLSNPVTAAALALQLIAEVSFAVLDAIDPMGYGNYVDNEELDQEMRRTQRDAIAAARQQGLELPYLFPLQEAFPDEWDAAVGPVMDGFYNRALERLSNTAGIEWELVPTVPEEGQEWPDPSAELVRALRSGQRRFTFEDIDRWNLLDMTHDHYLRVGDQLFVPVDKTGMHWAEMVSTPEEGSQLVDSDAVRDALRRGRLPGSTEVREFSRAEVEAWNVALHPNSYAVVDGRIYQIVDYEFEYSAAFGGDIPTAVLNALNRAYDEEMNGDPLARDDLIHRALVGVGGVDEAYVAKYPTLSTRQRIGVSLSREGVRWWNSGGHMGKHWVIFDKRQAEDWGYDTSNGVVNEPRLWTEISKPTTTDNREARSGRGIAKVGEKCKSTGDCEATAFCRDTQPRRRRRRQSSAQSNNKCETRRGNNKPCSGDDSWCDAGHFCHDQSDKCTPKRVEGEPCWNNPSWCADGLSCQLQEDRSRATCSASVAARVSSGHGTIVSLRDRIPVRKQDRGKIFKTVHAGATYYFRPLGDHKAEWYMNSDYHNHSVAPPSLLGTVWHQHDVAPPEGIELENDALATKLHGTRSLTDAQLQRLLAGAELKETHYVVVGDKFLTPWYFSSKPVAIFSEVYMTLGVNDALMPNTLPDKIPQYLPAGYLVSFCEKPRREGGKHIHPSDTCVRFEDGTSEYGIGCMYTDMWCTSMGMKHFYNHTTKRSNCRMDAGQAISEEGGIGQTVTRGVYRGTHDAAGFVCRPCCKPDEYCENRRCHTKKGIGTDVGNSAGWKCLSGIAEGLPSLCRECKTHAGCDGIVQTHEGHNCSVAGTCVCNSSYMCEPKKENCLPTDKSECTWAQTGCDDDEWCKDGFCDIVGGQANRCRKRDALRNRADGEFCNNSDAQCTSGLCVHHTCTQKLPACTKLDCWQTLEGTDHPCNRDADCEDGAVCHMVSGQRNTCRKHPSKKDRPRGEYCDSSDQCRGSYVCRGYICHDLRNEWKSCHSACNGGGVCPGFCGRDGACCRHNEEKEKPECRGHGPSGWHSCIETQDVVGKTARQACSDRGKAYDHTTGACETPTMENGLALLPGYSSDIGPGTNFTRTGANALQTGMTALDCVSIGKERGYKVVGHRNERHENPAHRNTCWYQTPTSDAEKDAAVTFFHGNGDADDEVHRSYNMVSKTNALLSEQIRSTVANAVAAAQQGIQNVVSGILGLPSTGGVVESVPGSFPGMRAFNKRGEELALERGMTADDCVRVGREKRFRVVVHRDNSVSIPSFRNTCWMVPGGGAREFFRNGGDPTKTGERAYKLDL